MSHAELPNLADVFQATAGLPATQRLILVHYATQPRQKSGAVLGSGLELAESAGLNWRSYSRVRLELVEAGYLEEVPEDRQGVTRVYRLTAKALGTAPANAPAQQTAA